MNPDPGTAAIVAASALASVASVLLLVGGGISLLVRWTADPPPVEPTGAPDERALRARAAAVAVAVALAGRRAAPPPAPPPPVTSPWQLAMRTAVLTRWRSRR